MYLPPAFRDDDRGALRAVVDAARVGELLTIGPTGIEVSLLPFLLVDGEGPEGGFRASVGSAGGAEGCSIGGPGAGGANPSLARAAARPPSDGLSSGGLSSDGLSTDGLSSGGRSSGEPPRLLGHLARANPQASRPASAEAVVVFRVADAYVSPSWYPTAADGRAVPTWDYVMAEVRGPLVWHDDPDWCEAVVRKLTEAEEGRRADSWSLERVPRRFLDAQLRGIVGVELVGRTVAVKAKLSQNRPAADVHAVREAFGRAGPRGRAVQAEMDRRGLGRGADLRTSGPGDGS